VTQKAPRRSPLRFRGGKTWLAPLLRNWLLKIKPAIFVEPFAGGASSGLTAAFEGLSEQVVLGDGDPGIAALWGIITSGDAEWLAKRVTGFQFSAASVRGISISSPEDKREKAFRALVLNRVGSQGLAVRHGMGKKGGDSLSARWYPGVLARSIREIAHAGKITFEDGDGIDLINKYALDNKSAIFVDPPYGTKPWRGRPEVNHQKIFEAASRCTGDVLLTYPDKPEIRELATRGRLEVKLITRWGGKRRVLMIGKNLGWMESTESVDEQEKNLPFE